MLQGTRNAWFLLLGFLATGAFAQGIELDEENGCILCHGNPDVWEDDTQHLFVTSADLANDIHWQKGIKCQECHGGNAETFNLREAHATEDGFRTIESSGDVAKFCGHCHSNAEYMQRFQPDATTDPVERFLSSVHGKHLMETGGEQAATCVSCHPKHKMRSTDDPASAVHPNNLLETCGNCHTEQRTALRKGVHHAAGERDELGAGTPLACSECHGRDVHGMLAVKDAQSPVFLDHQVRVCGSCHEKYLATYDASVHGHGLRTSGLLVTAVCSDCHGAHDIYYAADRRSSLHTTNIAETCGKCHAFIEETLLASVHGQEESGSVDRQTAKAGKGKRKPSCIDCHQGHDLPHPDSTSFQLTVPNRCGNCHADYALRYGMSLHGTLTQLGYEPAAQCSECHGAHDILPLSNVNSRLSPENRQQTCRQCHPYASARFATFDPHANYKDEDRYPLLHGILLGTETLFFWLMGLFVLHAFLWFTRSFVHTLRFGRHRRPVGAEAGVMRYATADRVIYVLLVVSFLGLLLTSLPLKYSDQTWARKMSVAMGGFETTHVWHHFFATVVLVACGVHLVRMTRTMRQRRVQAVGWKQVLLGPDSPLPNRRDAGEVFGMLGWFFGLRSKPRFENWTYWEKFDYWALWLAVALIGGSGLVLWHPELFSRILPLGVLNVAHLLHSQMALMVAGCLFIIHFFHTHLRPEKFPLDLSLLTGVVSEDHLRTARPDYLQRLREEGRLEELRTPIPHRRRLRQAVAGGLLVIFLGTILLVWALIASFGK